MSRTQIQRAPVNPAVFANRKEAHTIRELQAQIDGLYEMVRGMMETDPGLGLARATAIRPRAVGRVPKLGNQYGQRSEIVSFEDRLFYKVQLSQDDTRWSELIGAGPGQQTAAFYVQDDRPDVCPADILGLWVRTGLSSDRFYFCGNGAVSGRDWYEVARAK